MKKFLSVVAASVFLALSIAPITAEAGQKGAMFQARPPKSTYATRYCTENITKVKFWRLGIMGFSSGLTCEDKSFRGLGREELSEMRLLERSVE